MCLKMIDDRKYNVIVNDILENDDFLQMRDIVHHGMNRYDHSVRVSYYSYKVAKLLCLSYEDVARGGLLHDFFLVKNSDIKFKDRIYTMYNHPKMALRRADECFKLTDKEKDIIRSHMFPISIRIPRYLESWIVNVVDDFVAIYERLYQIRYQIATMLNMFLVWIINYLG